MEFQLMLKANFKLAYHRFLLLTYNYNRQIKILSFHQLVYIFKDINLNCKLISLISIILIVVLVQVY